MSLMTRNAAIPSAVATHNVTVAPLDLHMEILDTRSFDVWLHQQPISEDEYRAFRPEPPYVKSGLGRSGMDFAWFKRSPGADVDGPLEQRIVGGREFVRVARPRQFRGLQQGDAPTRLVIDKHHVIGFEAASHVNFVRLPDGGWYVQQTAAPDGSIIDEPSDWEVFHVELAERWICDLGCPATVYFFRNLRSFQGPVPPEVLPATEFRRGRAPR